MPTPRELARETHAVLDEYLRVHAAVFHSDRQRFSALLPGQVGTSDLAEYVGTLQILQEQLNRIREDLWKTEADEQGGALFNFTLLNYVAALRMAVGKLEQMCDALARRRGGETYSATEFLRDVRHYRSLREQYYEFGGKLNRRYRGHRLPSSANDRPSV